MSQPQILVGSRRRMTISVGFGLVAVAIGVGMLASRDWVGIPIIVFCGFASFTFTALIFRPAKLTLTDRDFTFDALWRHSKYEYQHCSDFRVFNNSTVVASKLVVFEYNGPGKPPLLSRRHGPDGERLASVPSFYFRVPANDLADQLNARRSASPRSLD